MEDLANQTLTTDDKKLFEPSFHDPIPFCCNSIAGGYIRFGMSHNLPFYAARGVSEKRMYGANAMFPQGGSTTGNAKEIFRGASRSLKTKYASICPPGPGQTDVEQNEWFHRLHTKLYNTDLKGLHLLFCVFLCIWQFISDRFCFHFTQ